MVDGFDSLIVNMGFAVAVASFLIKWMTQELNKKLDKIIETQEMIAKTMNEVATTQKLLIELLRKGGEE